MITKSNRQIVGQVTKMHAGIKELTLCELLDDPLVVLLMRRDGISRSEVEILMAKIQIHALNRKWRMAPTSSAASARVVSEFPTVPAIGSQLQPAVSGRSHVD
jgi:hypothetical protein